MRVRWLTGALLVAMLAAAQQPTDRQPLHEEAAAAYQRQDDAVAEARWRELLAQIERTEPGSVAAAGCLLNLGLVTRARSDLAAARDCHQRALAIRERLVPGGRQVADSLAMLGGVARD